MQQFEWIHGAWLALAIVLEIVANVFLKFQTVFVVKYTAYCRCWRCWAPSARSPRR
ncbi:Spermidine export protein MdtI [Raoultella planticola]|uniref:Spermidine export protein MdtI n=1 Tax=Raoultella planticola TaxID=575 RepID=A0A485CUE8_RAOPL|nr:Spermidine export protein MdtI [Raoultella planticola]